MEEVPVEAWRGVETTAILKTSHNNSGEIDALFKHLLPFFLSVKPIGGGGSGFFACGDFRERFDDLFPACAFFVLLLLFF